jgi:hypothetical protein
MASSSNEGPTTVFIFNLGKTNLCVLDFSRTDKSIPSFIRKFKGQKIQWIFPEINDVPENFSVDRSLALRVLRRNRPDPRLNNAKAEYLYTNEIVKAIQQAEKDRVSLYIVAKEYALYYRDRLIFDRRVYQGSIKATTEYGDKLKEPIIPPLALQTGLKMYTYVDYVLSHGKEPYFDLLEGPVTITKVSGNGKTIILLGDEHSINQHEGCHEATFLKGQRITELIDFFRITMEHQQHEGRVLDIFLEHETAQERNRSDLVYMDGISGNYLNSLSAFFGDCIEGDKCWNHRVHSVDIRTLRKHDKIDADGRYNDPFNYLLDEIFFMNHHDRMNSPYHRKPIVLMAYVLLSSSKNPPPVYLDEFFQEGYLKVRKLQKQFDAIKDLRIRGYLSSLFNFLLARHQGIRLADVFFDVKKREGIFTTCTRIMDIFTLARMFRSYQKVPGIYSENPRDIIIYAGYAHAQSIHYHLTKLGLKTEYHSEMKSLANQNVQCVPSGILNNPFTSNPLPGQVSKVKKERRVTVDQAWDKVLEMYPFAYRYLFPWSSFKTYVAFYLYYSEPTFLFTEEYIRAILQQKDTGAVETLFMAVGIVDYKPTLNSLAAMVHGHQPSKGKKQVTKISLTFLPGWKEGKTTKKVENVKEDVHIPLPTVSKERRYPFSLQDLEKEGSITKLKAYASKLGVPRLNSYTKKDINQLRKLAIRKYNEIVNQSRERDAKNEKGARDKKVSQSRKNVKNLSSRKRDIILNEKRIGVMKEFAKEYSIPGYAKYKLQDIQKLREKILAAILG